MLNPAACPADATGVVALIGFLLARTPAGLELHPNIPSAATIRRVVLTAPVMAYVNRPRPKTGLEGKFSLQYTAPSALIDGKGGIRTFTDARLPRAAMR